MAINIKLYGYTTPYHTTLLIVWSIIVLTCTWGHIHMYFAHYKRIIIIIIMYMQRISTECFVILSHLNSLFPSRIPWTIFLTDQGKEWGKKGRKKGNGKTFIFNHCLIWVLFPFRVLLLSYQEWCWLDWQRHLLSYIWDLVCFPLVGTLIPVTMAMVS